MNVPTLAMGKKKSDVVSGIPTLLLILTRPIYYTIYLLIGHCVFLFIAFYALNVILHFKTREAGALQKCKLHVWRKSHIQITHIEANLK